MNLGLNKMKIKFRRLGLEVEQERRRLRSEVREDPLSGETRLVWGCGGRAEMLLFEGEFLAINVRRVPKTWKMEDLCTKFNCLSSSETIREAFFLSKSESPAFQTARILFTCRKKASETLKVLFSINLPNT